MRRHSLAAGLFKYGLASTFVKRVTPDQAFPDISKVTPPWAQIPEVVATPELPGMDLYPQGRYLQKPSCQMPVCYGLVMPDVTYYPRQGLLMDKKNRVIEDAHQVPMRTHWYDWRAFFPAKITEVEGASFVFRSFRQSIYHLLTDHLPALYTLGKLPWGSDQKIRLLLPSPLSEAEKYLVPRICPDNVEIVEIRAHGSYRLEQCYYVSQLAQRGCGFLPKWYTSEFLQRVAPNRPREKNRRIYISRANSMARRILNEAELIKCLQSFGFEGYELEKLSVAQQIDLFHDAEMVVAPHGAGLVNLLFAENAKVLELFEGPLLRPHYYFLSKACGHEYTYMRTRATRSKAGRIYDDFMESFNGSQRNFTVDCDQVVRKVENLL